MFLYQKYKYNYKHLDINDPLNTIKTIKEFLENAKKCATYMCYDTEADSLNVITVKPFLVSMGYYDEINKIGNVITFDYDAKIMQRVWDMYQVLDFEGGTNQNGDKYIGLFAHNGKFDFHVMENGG